MINIYNTYSKKIETDFESNKRIIQISLDKARNQNAAISNLLDQFRNQFNELQKILFKCDLGNFFQRIEQKLDLDKDQTEEQIFLELFLISNRSEIELYYLINYQVLKITIQHLENIRQQDNSTNQITSLHWGGTIETEIVQLIYALIEIGYIQDKDNIGKYSIVERFTKFLNFNLSKNWKDNLSSSVNDRNNDYTPEIFRKLVIGWNQYRDDRLQKNQSKRDKKTY